MAKVSETTTRGDEPGPDPRPGPPHTADPLAGVRVLELGSLIAGPFAGRQLADFGAEVIKIESPEQPDPMREWGRARVQGHTLWWSVQSRGKKCVTLDLKSPRGHGLFLELCKEADVILENFRPGTLEKLGLAPEELWKVNPGLIIARVSGYGQTGPDAQKPGYASVAEARGGLRYLNGYPDQAPPRTGISLGDSLASLYALQGILLALYWRDARGGTGQVVDVSLVEACFSLLESAVPDYAATGVVPGPSGSGLKGIAPSNIFRSKDGKWVVIAANQDSVFVRLAAAMGRPELASDVRYSNHAARGAHQDELESLIAQWAAGFSHEELTSLLDGYSVPNSPVSSIEDIFQDPQLRARGMLVDVPDEQLGTVVQPGIIPRLTRSTGEIGWSGPLAPGSHNREIYGGLLKLSARELQDAKDEGAI
ncbi:CaiB/BaiF CoA transferase family protein [Arthrobacter globiformis]|uniref:CaiB/BaiF CoA transferase family protein n=1 Tax=Arthrobacter globiformis TaxID=1665 RepID=UPI0027944CA6|nr:CaiB/BaiF CoA-transferase family protein [Arthrobacter globiformis]MDQ0619588.1 formyl-CoA transferase [Arthrobacter globiformis]